MIYGANGELFEKWDDAAIRVDYVPADALPGTPRTYPVDGYIEDENGKQVKINDIWFSELSEAARKPLLRELGLPVKKAIVYRDGGAVSPVLDFKITDVWNDWCNIVVKLGDGALANRTHSWFFSDVNGAPEKSNADGDGAPKKKKVPAKKKQAETDEVPGMPNTYVVFDLETTGLDADCQIAEIGALKVRNGKVVDEFSQLVYIDFPMPSAALKVNNITDEMLADAPHATEAMRAFVEFIGSNPVLVGHNIKKFDLPIIERVADACRVSFDFKEAIDTVTLAKSAWPDLDNHRMETLRKFLGIENEDAHRALADCEDEMAVYVAIREGVKAGTLSIKPKRSSGTRRPGATYNKNWGNKTKAKEIKPTVNEFDESNPLFGKLIVVSGDVRLWR